MEGGIPNVKAESNMFEKKRPRTWRYRGGGLSSVKNLGRASCGLSGSKGTWGEGAISVYGQYLKREWTTGKILKEGDGLP